MQNDPPRTPVYALGQLTIHDRDRYQRYAREFHAVLARYRGRLLAADEAPEVLEGAWERDKVILLRFDDAEAFWEWARSEEYQRIAQDRLAGAEGPVLLLRGLC